MIFLVFLLPGFIIGITIGDIHGNKEGFERGYKSGIERRIVDFIRHDKEEIQHPITRGQK